MYNKEYFINNFKEMGLLPTDTVFVHSSYKKIAGDVGISGGANTVIDAFIEYFGEKGLVVFPTMTWKLGYLINAEGDTVPPFDGPLEGFISNTHFDVKNTSCDYLGIFPELFRKRPGVIRSLCPTSSIAAYGSDAKEFSLGHDTAKTPLGWDSPWGKLYDRNAKFLFLGTHIACNTYMHVLEEHADVPGILHPYIWKFTLTDYDGNTKTLKYQRHVPNHNFYYAKVEAEFLENSIARKAKFGSADTHIIDCVKETEYMLKRLKETPFMFTKEYNE